jgi:hypothetical protein
MTVDTDYRLLTEREAIEAAVAGDCNVWLKVSQTYAKSVKEVVERRRKRFVADRTITDAIRRRQLGFHQVGRQRYTTLALIDEWLESLKC